MNQDDSKRELASGQRRELAAAIFAGAILRLRPTIRTNLNEPSNQALEFNSDSLLSVSHGTKPGTDNPNTCENSQ